MITPKTVLPDDILKATENWTISLSLVTWAIRNKFDRILVWNLPLTVLPTIKRLKTIPGEDEVKRFRSIEEYIWNTSSLRNDSDKPSLQEVSWKRYLVLWKDDIFEITKQKWPIYIAYHPIKDTYIVYKFLWEDSDKNTMLVSWLDKINPTDIEWYYSVSSSREEISTILAWNIEMNNIVPEWGYYYIWENWETQEFIGYNRLWELRKQWNAVFFDWQNADSSNELVIHGWNKVSKMSYWFAKAVVSQSSRNLLHVQHHNSPWAITHTLFDLDNMAFIFEWADRFDYNKSFPKGGVWTYEDEIFWEFHEWRRWLAKLLWKKRVKHSMVL